MFALTLILLLAIDLLPTYKLIFYGVSGLMTTSNLQCNFTGSSTKPEKECNSYKINFKIICYYLLSSNFEPSLLGDLCTHIHVGFFSIDEKSLTIDVSNDSLKILHKIVLIKKKKNALKIIIAIGGANATGFGAIVKAYSTRKKFIKNIIKILNKLNLDGVDIDWEWPVLKGTVKEKIQFLQLLYEFKQFIKSCGKNYILCVDVSSSKIISELAYNVRYMADYVNYVIMMGYDYHYFNKWYPFTGHNAPLYSSPHEFAFVNVNYSIHFWLLHSMPKEKIVLGVPTYGHTYRLFSPHFSGLHSPSIGVGLVGKNGFANYSTICAFINKSDTVIMWDNKSKVPYAYKFPDWISYDDEKSLTIKAVYAQRMRLGGVMIFSVNDDDYLGKCKKDGKPLPLTRKIRDTLINEI